MTLFRLTFFSVFACCFALEIDAPPEVYNQVKEYVGEEKRENHTLTVKLNREKDGVKFELSLIYNGKVVKQLERRADGAVNSVLQNAVFEILGKPKPNENARGENENSLGNGFRVAIAGAGIAALWAVVYFTEQPKVIDNGVHYKIEVEK